MKTNRFQYIMEEPCASAKRENAKSEMACIICVVFEIHGEMKGY